MERREHTSFLSERPDESRREIGLWTALEDIVRGVAFRAEPIPPMPRDASLETVTAAGWLKTKACKSAVDAHWGHPKSRISSTSS